MYPIHKHGQEVVTGANSPNFETDVQFLLEEVECLPFGLPPPRASPTHFEDPGSGS